MYESLFGFTPTVCACNECKEKCRHMSSMYTPEDLWQVERLYRLNRHLSFEKWCLEHLSASPGAIVLKDGKTMRIPTIVPRRLPEGRCHWLTAEDQCAIHETAPYGCRYFDCRQSKADADVRSMYALYSIMEDWKRGGIYGRIWLLLRASGLTVDGPEVARQRLQEGA